MPLANETALIQRCQRGDLAAFEQIYRHHEQRFLAIAWRMLDTRDEAEDALQDAMLKAFRSMGKFRADSSLSTWLHRIVCNTCYDRLRRRKAATLVDLDEVAEPLTDDDAEMRVHLQQAIAGLPPQLKACFTLHIQEGFKQREVADMLGIQEGTVKANVFHAKGKLRAALNERLKGWT